MTFAVLKDSLEQILDEETKFFSLDKTIQNRCRESLLELSKGSGYTEYQVVEIIKKKSFEDKNPCIEYYLISKGRYQLERVLNYKVPIKNRLLRLIFSYPKAFYFSMIMLMAYLLVILINEKMEFHPAVVCSVFLAGELATLLVHYIIMFFLRPQKMVRYNFLEKIPDCCQTFVVVQTMFYSEESMREQFIKLEAQFNVDNDTSLYYAILSDWCDSDTAIRSEEEQLIEGAIAQVDQLNQHYCTKDGINRFFFLQRKRMWNSVEKKWMGYERKRGKIHEFNRLLRGDQSTSFASYGKGGEKLPGNIVYVITLDEDNFMVKGAAASLIGAMAHPLNFPIINSDLNLVISGHGILQPRMSIQVPSNRKQTLYHWLNNGDCHYYINAEPIPSVYQDYFKQGQYDGKGIYHLDTFEIILNQRTPDNSVLSHDVYEGNFMRSGLLNDVDFLQENPSDILESCQIVHRWTRGDWQLLPFLLNKEWREEYVLGKWKFIDNLKKSLLRPVIFGALIFSIVGDQKHFFEILLMSISYFFLPNFINTLRRLVLMENNGHLGLQLKFIGRDFYRGILHVSLDFFLIPCYAFVQMDAILRTLYRIYFSKKNLLEWKTTYLRSHPRP